VPWASLVVGIGTPPPPHPQASVAPPPFGSVEGGGAHSLGGEGAGGAKSDEGTDIVILKV
jgi:hypothetical protein